MAEVYKCALIGFGKISAGYDIDAKMAAFFNYVTHVQVLKDHPQFSLSDVVDPNDEARKTAQDKWAVPSVWANVDDMAQKESIEVLIIATPPNDRLSIIKQFPNLKALLCEKPLGVTRTESQAIVEWCAQNNILLQVNYWRRAEKRLQSLVCGELADRLGHIKFATAVYGNGLHNNGGHIVDMTRMLFGEPDRVQAHDDCRRDDLSPIAGDVALSFSLYWENGMKVTFQAIDFADYREVGLEIWGENGRLDLMQETLSLIYYPKTENRGVTGEYEISCDQPENLGGLSKNAFFDMYGNLCDAMAGKGALCSSGSSALINDCILEAALISSREGCRVVSLK